MKAPKTNDWVVHVATVNGSGSQSSNNVLLKSLFRSGLPVTGKNLFPSNIQGLPTWFTIRVNEDKKLSRRSPYEVVIAMNLSTIAEDIKTVNEGGVFIYNSDLKFEPALLRKDVTNIGIPFRSLSKDLSKSVQLNKLLTNMVYVGIIGELVGLKRETIHQVISDQFGNKTSVIEVNQKAIDVGAEYANENLEIDSFPYKVSEIKDGNKDKILIDGNTAAGLGLVYGGCTFVSWYPITPSSSLAESFEKYANKLRKDEQGKNKFAVVQAEDELSAISMVMGAGWSGARAMTTTSGPGLSLMAEAAGMSYFAEIPSVIWDVQRAGPSTGLPTRTMQCDLTAAYKLSHGDTKHIVLLPGNPKECFEFGQIAFDMAERFQSLVIVLTDLDLGMNSWICDEFKPSSENFDRGKVLSKDQLEKQGQFARYKDLDGDGIPQRTLPGTEHNLAAYFTRGTGHAEDSSYTENNEVFKKLLDRLQSKIDGARTIAPQPIIEDQCGSKVGFIGFGSSHEAIQETRREIMDEGTSTDYLRLRSLPISPKVYEFIERLDTVFVVEQNRDQQLFHLLLEERPDLHGKIKSVAQYDGLPLESRFIQSEVSL